MRIMELVTQLNEYRSTPTSLKMMASRIEGALAGFEMEMYVQGTVSNEYDEFEMNYDENSYIYSISDVEDFFYDGDFNSRRDCAIVEETMREEYTQWLTDKAADEWENEKEEAVRDYILENVHTMDELKDEWLADNDVDPDDEEKIQDGANELLDAIVQDAIGNNPDDDYAEQAYESWNDTWMEENIDQHETEWLRSEGLDRYSDVSEQYAAVEWPHYRGSSEDEVADFRAVARDIAAITGREVDVDDDEGGYDITPNTYVVTSDASLHSPPEDGMGGVEIISPPLPIVDALDDFQKIVQWAKTDGAQTNRSTGLHINVSVPGVTRERLDYLKLAILIGDQHILEQFNRIGNSMARSAMNIIKQRAVSQPADVEAVLRRMKSGFDQVASKLIHSGYTDKFTSINTKEGYVEFRAPGGDWLETEVDIPALLYRYVVALDAAMDPMKHRQEYLKKLYKVFRGSDRTDDPLHLFVQYASGHLDKNDLKAVVRQRREEILKKKQAQQAGEEPQEPILNWRDELQDRLRQARNPQARHLQGEVGNPEDA